MFKLKSITWGIILFCLFSMNFLPLLGTSNLGESGAPDGSGVTIVHWYIASVDDVKNENRTFWTKDITLNSSGKMYWHNVSAFVIGNLVIRSGAYFNLTDCFINLTGNLSIDGEVNFDNVTLIMNSSYDGEFGINVATSGKFNVMNRSNITAYDTTTGIDLDSSIPGNETWGLHYNFTVHGKLKIDDSYISYTYGNLNYYGGIHLYSTSDATITNSTIYENEITAIYAEGLKVGGAQHLFKNNHIYNATVFGIYLYHYANATIDDNIIETYLTNYGTGILCDDHCAPKIYRNTIKNNRFDGIFLVDYSNATIWNNTISNNHRVGIFLNGRVTAVSPPNVYATICNPLIQDNYLIDNFEFGIYDRCCHAQIINNTITSTQNRSGIYVISYQTFNPYIVHFSCEGNITNNTIKNNNYYGIELISVWQPPWIITMDIKNNTIVNNNWSGLAVFGGLDNNNVQRSPIPDIGFNNISNNNENGILTTFALAFNIWENKIDGNNLSGAAFRNSSKPLVFNNNISRNLEHGLDSKGVSTPDIHDNMIYQNNHSGVYCLGGNNNLKLKNNEIFSNSWAGIEGNNTDCVIQSNDINNNSQTGIKLTGGSTTINANNYVIYNNGDGLACYQNARPLLAANYFSYNTKNGINLDNSNPRTGLYENLITNNGANGVYCGNGAGGSVFGNISSNSGSGVFTSGIGTDTVFINSVISNNGEHGVNTTNNSAPEITNSTIADDNSGYAFYLSGSSDPVALNSTFTTPDVYFSDSASVLTRKWFVNIRTISDADSSAVPNTIVWINSTGHPPANPLWTGQTDFNGKKDWIRIIEYTEMKSGQTQYSPMVITGDAFNYRTTQVTPNPTIDRSKTIIISLLPNNPPFGVTNIIPSHTHNTHPTISWDHATDPDGHSVGYKVWIGTFQNQSNLFAHNSPLITTNHFNLTTELDHDSLDGNNTYHITIVTNDRHGAESYSFQRMYLTNHKPSKPGISLNVPEVPTVLLKSVTCTITNLSIDPDGDEINYTYRWYKNGQQLPSLTKADTKDTDDTISIFTDSITFSKGDTWEVKVYANDGIGFNNMVSEITEFTIGNVGPTIATKIDDIVMDEDEKKMDIIDLNKVFNDIDEDGDLKFFITVDNVNLTVKKDNQNRVDITPALNWNGEAEINITCYDSEGLWVTQFFEVTVKAINDKPEFETIGGLPWRPGITISMTEDKAAFEEKWFNITITGSDADIENGEDDELSFKVSEPDKILVTPSDLDPLTATLSFFPKDEDVGLFTFTISVKDKYSSNYLYETTIEIQVRNVNDKPTLISIETYSGDSKYEFPEDNILDLRNYIKLNQDDKLTLIITASDPDLLYNDDVLTFHTDALDFIEIDTNTGNEETAKIIISPKWNNIGLLKLNITVKDSLLVSDSVQIILNVVNINDKPKAYIDQPATPNNQYYQSNEIVLAGDADDLDLAYGDELTFTWSSDLDGVLGYGSRITVSNLSLGKHFISLTVEDSAGEKDSNSTTIRIQMDEEPPEVKKKDEDGSADMFFILVMVVMVIIIIVMLLILFLFLKRKGKEQEPKIAETPKPFVYTRPGEEPSTTGAVSGTPGVIKPPIQYVPQAQGIPQSLPDAGQQAQFQQQLQQLQQQPIVAPPTIPQQITTCPKCNNIMTFGPDGTPFCFVCGYAPGRQY